MMETLSIRDAQVEDCPAIATLAAKTFSDTFGHHYRPEDLEKHLATHCSAHFFHKSLAAGNTLLMAMLGDTLIGYGKVGIVGLPVKPLPAGAVEIHRVYIDKPYQGLGYGKALMLHILSLPRVFIAPAVYLGVWEENIRAQALYKQFGFQPAGRYLYYVGDHADRELIMARKK